MSWLDKGGARGQLTIAPTDAFSARRWILLLVVAMGAACDSPRERVVEDAAPSAAIERCVAAMTEQPQDRCDRRAALKRLWQECAPMYKVPACRDAFLAAASQDRESMATRIVTQMYGCRVAYCPLLAQPLPSMCSMGPAEIGALRMADKQARWGELDRAIIAHDHGPQAGKGLTVTVAAPDQRPRVILEDEGSVTIVARLLLVLPLRDAADEAAFVAALRDQGASSGVILEPGSATPVERLTRVHDVIRTAGISNIENREPCPSTAVSPPAVGAPP